MTDNEIIKALEHCVSKRSCNGCIAYSPRGCQGIDKGLLNIINRQKEEIDILIRKKETLRDEIAGQQAEIERLKEIEWMYNDLCK